jgi:toxin secretion/phage lysis holin
MSSTAKAAKAAESARRFARLGRLWKGGENQMLLIAKKPEMWLSAVSGLFFSWFGGVWPLILLAFAAILLDYMTGTLAGRANEGISGKKMTDGIYKKTGLILLLVFGFLMDVAFNQFIAQGFNYQLPFDMPIGLIISVWIFITEAISICENLERLGVPIPAPLVKMLRKVEQKIDKEDEGK